MKQVKWQVLYLDGMSKATNEEVLDEYTYLSGGDNYDGCYTKQGEWKFKEVSRELMERLTKCGFLKE